MTAGRGTAVIAALLLLSACQTGSPSATRSPRTSAPATGKLRVVTIGDSIPFGKEDCGGCFDFTTLLAAALHRASGKPVAADNLSTHDNLTGARLLDRIRTVQEFRQTVSQGDVIVVTIGHNDTPWNSSDDPCDGNNPEGVANWAKYVGACVTQQVQRHGSELDGILSEIQSLRAGKPTALRVTTDYNDVTGPTAGAEAIAASMAVVDAFARETCRVAALHHAVCVDVYHAFNGADGREEPIGLLAADHTHPNGVGQRRIADLLIAAGFAPILAATPS